MPAFLVAAMPFLAALLGALAFRIAVGIGFGLISYIGLGILMDSIVTEIGSVWTGLPADLAAMAYILQLDRCINLLVSAYIAKMTMRGMTVAGTLVAVRWAIPS